MARFYVGQRVRLARPFFAKNAGLTGIVVELWSRELPDAAGGFLNCSVDWDDGRKSIRELDWPCSGRATHTDRLEPLTPPHEACDADFKAELDELLARQRAPA